MNLPTSIGSPSTMALHFDFSAMRGALWDLPKRVVVLERALRVLSQVSEHPGSEVVGIGMLFSSQRDVDRHRRSWLVSLGQAEVCAGSTRPAMKDELEDILVVTISGHLKRLANSAVAKLKRPRSFRFLFSVQFTGDASPVLCSRYLGESTMWVGRFTGSREFALSGEAMLIEEELHPMWARLGVNAAYTDAALCSALALLSVNSPESSRPL